MNSKTLKYGNKIFIAPIFKGIRFRRVKPPDEDAESCGNLWHGLMKLATKMAFGAEIGGKTGFWDRNS
jgi:hypothetical protein